MTPEAQRIAIAEFCGWKYNSSNIAPFGADTPWRAWHDPSGARQKFIPDYLSDLNAMNEAESKLEWKPDDEYCQAAQYYEHLVFVCGTKTEPPDVYEWHLIRATASQRSEALLRTVGRWVDSTLASEPVQG